MDAEQKKTQQEDDFLPSESIRRELEQALEKFEKAREELHKATEGVRSLEGDPDTESDTNQ